MLEKNSERERLSNYTWSLLASLFCLGYMQKMLLQPQNKIKAKNKLINPTGSTVWVYLSLMHLAPSAGDRLNYIRFV